MKTFTCFFSLFLYSIHCLAQTFTYNQGGVSAKNYYAEIPYETINGKIFVSVGLAGKTHKFLFDTGAPVMLSDDLVEQMGAAVVYRDKLTDAYGGHDSISAVKIDSLRLGPLTFDTVVASRGIPAFYKCWGAEGVIGSNLLRGSIVRIVPERQIIILTDQEERLQLDKNKSIPLVTNIGIQSDPKIVVRFGGKTDLLLGFDTGDGTLLRISEDDLDRLKRSKVCNILSDGYGSHTFSMTGMAKDADKYLVTAPSVDVDGRQFSNVTFETFKNANPGMGAGLLKYGSVTLDFLHGRFYFEPKDTSLDLSEKQWPFQPTLSGDKLVVGLIWKNRSSQLKPGQQIIAIDDISFEHVDFCNLINRPPLLAGKETAEITVKDEEGNITRVRIEKE